jgi:hypothetical protein
LSEKQITSLDRMLRAAAGIGAVSVTLVLLLHRSVEPDVLQRYSLAYLVWLVTAVPAVVGGLWLALGGGSPRAGLRTLLGEGRLLALGLLFFLPPLLLLAWRYRLGCAREDLLRAVSILLLAVGYLLFALAIAGRRGRVRVFLAGSAIAFAVLDAVVLLFSPVFGGWVERSMGKSSITTLDVVGRREADSTRRLIDQPNAEFVYTGSAGAVREFEVAVRNNSQGFHDRERSIENPDGRTRIVVVGDSYVQSLEVLREESFPALLEDLLNRERDRFEVIPLARRDGGQEMECELLTEHGLSFDPDLVVLVSVPNDLLANDPDLRALATRSPRALLFPGLLVDRLLTGWLFRHAYLLNEKYRLGALAPQHWAYLDPTPEPIERAYQRTAEQLDRIVDAARGHGSDLLLTARRFQNVPRWLARYPGLREYSVDPDAHHDWMVDYTTSRGIHYVDNGPAFQEYYYEHPTGDPEQYTWPNDGHWRQPGHRIVAELLYQYLVENGLLGLGRRDEPSAEVTPGS